MANGTEFDPEAPENLSSTVVRGAWIAALGYAGAQVVTLGFYLALARLATPSEFGQLAAGSLVAGLGTVVTESGMMAALIHRRGSIEVAANTATVATFVGGIIFTLLALAVSPLVGAFFKSSTVTAVAAVMSGTILLRTLDVVPEALLQRRFSFVRRTVVEPASALAFGLGAVIGCANGLGVWGLVIGQYASTLAAVLLSWILARWRPKLSLASFETWREMAGYGRHVLASVIVLRIGQQSDTIWLGRFLGTAALGQYRYAFRLASTPLAAIIASASYVLFPAFARIRGDRERFERGFVRSLRWICLIGFPAGLIMVPLGEPLAVTLFGDVWRPAGIAASFMCLFCAGRCLSSIVAQAIMAQGRTSQLTRINTVLTVATVAAMGALVPFGLNGVAAGLSVGAVIGGGYAIRTLKSTIGFNLRDTRRAIGGPAAASIVMAAVVYPLETFVFQASQRGTAEALLLLALETCIAGAIYLAALRLASPQGFSDLRSLLAENLSGLRKRLRPASSAAESRSSRG